MIFGIDLGTTNSCISLNGNVISSLTPSIVNLDDFSAGEKYSTDPEAVRSFKVDVSTGDEGQLSIDASAAVLKTLCSEVHSKGYVVKDVIISVPAFFTDNQRQATTEAAKRAGLNCLGLVNEPTAAAIYANRDKRGITVVYDLGGGTFDVTALDSRTGVLTVLGTSGIKLGGDDLDQAIFQYAIRETGIKTHRMTKEDRLKLLLMAKDIKHYIQKHKTTARITISDPRLEAKKDAQLTLEGYTEIVKRVFKETLTQLNRIIDGYVDEDEDWDLMFVGGSTRCPILREWIESETMVKAIPINYDQDLVVAQGVGLYAQMVDEGVINHNVIDVVSKTISVGLSDGTGYTLINQNSQLPTAAEGVLETASPGNTAKFKLYQGNSILSKNNEFIGELVYPFGKDVPEKTPLFLNIEVNESGIIMLKVSTLIGEPKSIKIDRRNVTE